VALNKQVTKEHKRKVAQAQSARRLVFRCPSDFFWAVKVALAKEGKTLQDIGPIAIAKALKIEPPNESTEASASAA